MWKRVAFGACLFVLLAARPAAAGLLPVHVGVAPEGSDFRYTYSIQLQSGAILQPGDYFTVFDFAGLVHSHNAQPVGFDYGSAATGPTPTRLNPLDDGAVSNLTWTYTGTGVTGPLDLGAFSAVSHYGETTDGAFTGQTHRQVDGHLDGNITDTRVPVPLGPGVPEPSTIVMALVAIPVVLGLYRFRLRETPIRR